MEPMTEPPNYLETRRGIAHLLQTDRMAVADLLRATLIEAGLPHLANEAFNILYNTFKPTHAYRGKYATR